MEYFDLLEWYRHFTAVNQIRLNTIKQLLGTIMMFMCAGGIERFISTKLNIKNDYYKVLYYLTIGMTGIIFYFKLV
jgi:hypothetical protein